MRRIDIVNSVTLNKRFCKDYNIPIALFDQPYFASRLHTVAKILGDKVLDDYETFVRELEAYPSEQDYFAHYNATKDAAIDFIKATPDFTNFIGETFIRQNSTPKRNLYIEPNHGGTFISIDMKKANFSALRYHSPDIFGGAETWAEFIGKFTPSKHIQGSKYVRQVIMGACNPKRQIQYEHYLMSILLNHIENSHEVMCGNLSVYSLGEDEILLMVNESFDDPETIYPILLSEPNGIGNLVRAEMFWLEKINDGLGWMKHYIQTDENRPNHRTEFKCVEAELFHQVAKYFIKEENEDFTEEDLVFFHNGRLARFLEPIPDPFPHHLCT